MIHFKYLTADGEEKTAQIDEKFVSFYLGDLRTKVEQFRKMAELTYRVAQSGELVKTEEE